MTQTYTNGENNLTHTRGENNPTYTNGEKNKQLNSQAAIVKARIWMAMLKCNPHAGQMMLFVKIIPTD